MKKIGLIFLLLLLVCSLVLAQEAKAEPLKIAFVYIGPPGDLGWTYMHDVGRKQMMEVYGDQVDAGFIESIEEGPDSSRIMRHIID